MKNSTKILLIVALILIIVLPLMFVKGDYEGADGQAEGVIEEIAPDYEPWFNSLFEPASGEIESLLFALQAALGAIVIGYYFGYQRGKHKEIQKQKR